MALTEEERRIANGEMEKTTPRSKKAKTAEQVQKEIRAQISLITDQTGREVSNLIVPIVSEQIAVNTIQSLPESIEGASNLLQRFFTGIATLEGENSILPECQIDHFIPAEQE